ncbi:hypothetical protein ACLOJK_030298 [Asimina triloba]
MSDSRSRGNSYHAWNRCMSLARTCSNMRQLKAIHAIFTVHGIHINTYAISKLIAFCALAPSGSVSYASLLFHRTPSRNSFIYNTLIRAYSRSTQPHRALVYFRLMLDEMPETGVIADQHTFPFVLAACAGIPSASAGEQIHATIFKNGLAASDNLVQTALARMYVETCLLGSARKLFDEIPERDAVLWNVVMNGYLRSGIAHETLALFRDMLVSDTEPDGFCIATGLAACAHSGALQQGIWMHELAKRNGYMDDIFIGTSLVDMYAKCGCIDKAVAAFEDMKERNAFSWAALISGLAMHGFAKEAILCLERMQEEDGLHPDGVVLLGVLTACSHAGLKEEGYSLLGSMEKCYGVAPKHEHYSCMVDLLCRAGQLDEALALVWKMPTKPLASVWGTLLSGSRILRCVELAELAAKELLELERDGGAQEDDGVYVQLSSVYLCARRQEDARRVRNMMGSRGIKKTPGCSIIEVDGKVNEFVAGDEAHPLQLQIHKMLYLLHDHISFHPRLC